MSQKPSKRPGRVLLGAGFILAVISLVFGFLAAIPAIVIGIVVITRGRPRPGVTIIALAIVLPVAFYSVLIGAFGGRAFRAPSASMSPTIEVGERFITTKTSEPQRGDLVVFKPPAGADENTCGVRRPARSACPKGTPGQSEVSFIKRVVAVEGDRVAIRGGRVVLDGQVQDEPYLRPSPDCGVCNLPREITVPAGHFFAVGDNRGESADSREWGPVPDNAIVGEVRLRYWPPGRAGRL